MTFSRRADGVGPFAGRGLESRSALTATRNSSLVMAMHAVHASGNDGNGAREVNHEDRPSPTDANPSCHAKAGSNNAEDNDCRYRQPGGQPVVLLLHCERVRTSSLRKGRSSSCVAECPLLSPVR